MAIPRLVAVRAAIATAFAALASARPANAHDLEPQRQLVHAWADAFNARKFERLRAILAPNYINHNRNVPSGAEATIAFLKGVAASLPNARLTVEDVITEGYKVASRMTLSSKSDSGVSKGTIIDMWRVEDGKLAEHWDSAS